MSDAEIQNCIQNESKAPGTWSLGYTCGDWAKRAAEKCCLNGDGVPESSRGAPKVAPFLVPPPIISPLG